MVHIPHKQLIHPMDQYLRKNKTKQRGKGSYPFRIQICRNQDSSRRPIRPQAIMLTTQLQ
jgi:hypothetical protein